MYETLLIAKPETNQMDDLEEYLIDRLRSQPTQFLEKELKLLEQVDDITTYSKTALSYLLLLAMHRSEEAFAVLTPIRLQYSQEYGRMVNMIAKQLEKKGFPYRAQCIRSRVTGQFPKSYPFGELSDLIVNDFSPLPSLLIKLAMSKLEVVK